MIKMEADVIVVAAGVSGLAASIAAAQQGAKVITFEKGSTTGGTGNMGMGPFGVESRLQRLKQHGPTRDEAFKIFMDYTHWRVDAQLVRAYIDKAATTIDWLETLGVEFVEAATYFPRGCLYMAYYKTCHRPTRSMAAATMMKILTRGQKNWVSRFFSRALLKRSLKQGDKIIGVMAEDKSGEQIQASAKAVVIATGGFGDNPDLIKKYCGFEWGKDLSSFRIPAWQAMVSVWPGGRRGADGNEYGDYLYDARRI